MSSKLKRPSGKTIWLSILTLWIFFGFSLLLFNDGLIKESIEDNPSLDYEYVNTIAGVIYRQNITNCQLQYQINEINSNTTIESADNLIEFVNCKAVGELGLEVLKDLKENPQKYSDNLGT